MKKTLLLNGKETEVNVYISTEEKGKWIKNRVSVEYFENPYREEKLTERQIEIFEEDRGSIIETLESIYDDFIKGNRIISYAFHKEKTL